MGIYDEIPDGDRIVHLVQTMHIDDMGVYSLHIPSAVVIRALVILLWVFLVFNLALYFEELPILIRMAPPNMSWNLCVGTFTERAAFLWSCEGSEKQKFVMKD